MFRGADRTRLPSPWRPRRDRAVRCPPQAAGVSIWPQPCRRHPIEMRATEVTQFLSSLAVQRHVEVRAVLQHLNGIPRLLALLYDGVGLRLPESARLRVQALDFGAT